jgi:hypothetical protein
MGVPPSAYTPAEIDAIAAWLRADCSAGEIAARLSAQRGTPLSRNAVIGIVLRNRVLNAIGFSRGARQTRLRGGAPVKAGAALPPRPPRPRAEPKAAPPRAIMLAAPAPKPLPFAGRAADIVVVPLPFLRAATEKRCLFYVGDAMSPDGPDMPVCGCLRQTASRKPYCALHLACEAA